jgi:hypothetical protein
MAATKLLGLQVELTDSMRHSSLYAAERLTPKLPAADFAFGRAGIALPIG